MLGLSYVYAVHGVVEWVDALFYVLGAAVVGIIAAAVIKIGRKALRNSVLYLVAAVAFVSIFFLHVPFPIIVIGARLLGLLAGPLWPETRSQSWVTTSSGSARSWRRRQTRGGSEAPASRQAQGRHVGRHRVQAGEGRSRPAVGLTTRRSRPPQKGITSMTW